MNHDQHTLGPRIETERLLLRWFVLDDVDAFHELGTDPQAIRYVGNTPYASIDVARETLAAGPLNNYATHGFGRFACVWKETGRVIGFCGPKFLPDLQEVELGYRFLPSFWGLGLATESSLATIAYVRNALKLRRLIALVHPDNVASARVLEKLAFSFEREATVSWFPNVDLDLYAKRLDG